MLKHLDKEYPFKDALKREGVCRIQIFQKASVSFYMVFFTELKKNTGPSVTNSIEYLIKSIFDGRNGPLGFIDPDDAIFLFAERYEEHPEYFDWVQLGSNGSPVWTRATSEEIKTILPHLDFPHA